MVLLSVGEAATDDGDVIAFLELDLSLGREAEEGGRENRGSGVFHKGNAVWTAKGNRSTRAVGDNPDFRCGRGVMKEGVSSVRDRRARAKERGRWFEVRLTVVGQQRLDVESELHDVAVFDDVLFTFDSEFAGFACFAVAAERDEIVKRDGFSGDEAAFEV